MATRLIVQEALEAEQTDFIGRDDYARWCEVSRAFYLKLRPVKLAADGSKPMLLKVNQFMRNDPGDILDG